jgi:AAA family ATP:ADP antiporter
VPFFVWLGIINMFIVSQFWAFANDIYTEGQGRRLFPLVGVGQSLGAWLGAAAVAPLVAVSGTYTLILLGALVILTALGLTLIVNRREAGRDDAHVRETETATLGREGGFELLLKDRYLFWIAMLVMILNLVNTTGGYVLDRLIESEAAARFGATPTDPAASRDFITAFSGSIGSTVNLLGFLLQLFVTSRVIRHLGVRGGLFILPLLALVNYAIIAVAPILAVVRIGKILENSTDYSIQNTVRQALFLPTSREAKYKAKAAIDTFCSRIGDVASAGVVFLGQVFTFALPVFAALNVAFAAAWVLVAGRIATEHRRRTV